MYTTLLLSALSATSFAIPFAQTPAPEADISTWTPAPGSKTTCDTTSDKIVAFYTSPSLETVLNDACAEMMDPCAYADRLPEDTVCIQTVTWPLRQQVTSQQAATVQDLEGNEVAPWNVQFTVTPAKQPENSPGVFWTREECYGYFEYVMEKEMPEGCRTENGMRAGNVTVGGETTLKDTVFEVTIVAG